MSSTDDFIIKDGILQRYIGKGDDAVVTSIGERAFEDCCHLTSAAISK